ncbi:hypothetical protein [Caballeronia sp.]|uniref:hypothetical protein n=1 Tax=Caballeronia sp. TaxID=1931223 RepID=UPI003C5F3FC0
MSAEEARTTYLEALFAKGFDYDFFPLTAVRYDAFIADWKEDDNKNAMPEKYRSDKRFGVISDIATLRDVDGRCEFWISIGWASGSISQRQSDDAGIKGKYLVAEVYIVNGLGEVETVQRGSDAFEDAFARLEMTLAFGFAERMNDADKGWFWVPPGRFLLNRKLRDSIVSTWRADFEARELKSDLCVMAALKHPPKFDDVEAQFRKPF